MKKWVRLLLVLFMKSAVNIPVIPHSNLIPFSPNSLLNDAYLDIKMEEKASYFEEQDLFEFAEQNRYFRVSGFKFCKMLDKSEFDALVPIKDLEGSVAEKNPDLNLFINMIDSKAYDIFQALLRAFHMASVKEVKRVSCYLAAEGQSTVANLTQSSLLHHVDPINYFKDIIPSIAPERSYLPGPRRKFKIAYLLMVHDIKGFEQITLLLDILDDGDAITLIHVDAREKCEKLYKKLDKWVSDRSDKNPESAIFMARNRFHNIWGHISLVFTQLAGFWELLDLADWDYIINLSNYDWPIKRNAQIHKLLSQEKYKNKNFIEYWSETSDLAERFYRVHLGEEDYSSVYHPAELGVVTWPFNHWRAYKHHQWMILTPEAVKFFRSDPHAITFLAFAEHTYIPDESYIATVMVNSPQFFGKILNNNKRYLRFNGGSHPAWLGYKDRYLFPTFEEDPSFYFIRKMNALGTIFGEHKLIEWISENHYIDEKPGKCTLEQISVRIECLKEFGEKIAEKNQLVVVPFNSQYFLTTANLICSFSKLGINNIIYWTLDLDIYESLLAQKKAAILIPGLNPIELAESPKSPDLKRIMRAKPKVIKMILDAGFSVWYLDSDTVALKDFRFITDNSADVFIALDNGNHLSNLPPVPSAGIMHFRQGKASLDFIDMVQQEVDKSSILDDEDAIRRLLSRQTSISVSLPDRKLYSRDLFSESLDPNSIHVKYLDPFSFMSSKIFINAPLQIPKDFDDFYLIHTHSPSNNQDVLVGYGLWLVDKRGTCVKSPTKPDFRSIN
ncbi:hypothetical protein HK103_007453 [Boothiomyces macroporosus]|uniref:protein xylosyltransferase n=1 Tax=Boothiomyces macroporosus TaxID=261099 RepID=A0AAD5Y1G1_9FUNG|nr:hypothetical protein HK103_007453 [Boothiomyces macroporosus]